MEDMISYSEAAMERAMKVEEVILRAIARKITWWQAAEIIGISDRQMRRWRQRYEEFGVRGLYDRRRGKPSPKRVPLAEVEKVLQLYGEKYFDLNVRHFHEKLAARASGEVELQLGERLAARGRTGGQGAQARGASQATAAATLTGHAAAYRRQPASLVSGRTLVRPDRHPGRRQQRDLLCAAGGGRIDGDGHGCAVGGGRVPRSVLRLVQRPGQSFLADAEGRRQGRSPSSDASGESAARAGGADDSCLLAAGPRTQ